MTPDLRISGCARLRIGRRRLTRRLSPTSKIRNPKSKIDTVMDARPAEQAGPADAGAGPRSDPRADGRAPRPAAHHRHRIRRLPPLQPRRRPAPRGLERLRPAGHAPGAPGPGRARHRALPAGRRQPLDGLWLPRPSSWPPAAWPPPSAISPWPTSTLLSSPRPAWAGVGGWGLGVGRAKAVTRPSNPNPKSKIQNPKSPRNISFGDAPSPAPCSAPCKSCPSAARPRLTTCWSGGVRAPARGGWRFSSPTCCWTATRTACAAWLRRGSRWHYLQVLSPDEVRPGAAGDLELMTAKPANAWNAPGR